MANALKITSLPCKDGKYCYEMQYDEDEPTILELDERLPEGSLRIYQKPTPLPPEPIKKGFTILGHKPDGTLAYNLMWMGLIYYWILISSDVGRLLWAMIGLPLFALYAHEFVKRYWEIKKSRFGLKKE